MDQSKPQNVQTPFGDTSHVPIPLSGKSSKVRDVSHDRDTPPVTRDSRFTLLLVLCMALTALAGGYMLFTGPLATYTRAFVQNPASPTNSYVFAYPLTIRADGQDTSIISVFIADGSSRPLSGKRITARTSAGMINTKDALTDPSGQVSFSLTMAEPAMAEISFLIEGEPFAKQITVQGE